MTQMTNTRCSLGQSVTPASRTRSRNGTSWHNFKRGAGGLCLGLLIACSGQATRSDPASNSTTTGGGPTSGGGGGPTSGGGGGPTSGGADGPTSGGGGPTSGGNGISVTGGTYSPDCPSVEPAVYSSCTIESLACRYDYCVAPDYRDDVVMVCYQGAWQLFRTEGCTSPDECPPYVTLGNACGYEGWEGSLGPCSGQNACGQYQAYCIDGSWQLRAEEVPPDGSGGEGGADGTAPTTSVTTSPAPVPECPTYPPLQGTSCCPNDFPAYCAYSEPSSDSVSATQTVASVVGGPAGTVGGFFSLFCAECSPTMVWTASDACP